MLTALPALAVGPHPIQTKVPLGAGLSHQGAGLTLEVGSVGGVSPPGNQQVDKNTWLYLEEMANTLLSNAQQLKSLIEQAKQGAAIGKELRKEVTSLHLSAPEKLFCLGRWQQLFSVNFVRHYTAEFLFFS